MLAFDRRAAKVAWTVALVALAFLLAFCIRKTVFIFLLAVFFSYMVFPAVRRLSQYTPKRFSHTASTAVVFALIILLVAGGLALIGPPIADESSRLANELPALVKDPHFIDRVPLPEWAAPFRTRAAAFIQSQLASGSSQALPIARQVGQAALAIASNAIFVVLIPILSFLLIKDASAMREGFLSFARKTGRGRMWERIVDGLDVLLGRYIRSLLILSAATLLVYSIAFSVAGVPYALLLAALAAVLEFIPVIGPLGAAVVIVVVSGLGGYQHLLFVIGFIAVYRLFQDYVLNPYLMSGGVEVPPLMVLFGLLAGEEIGGVIGIFLSVPALAMAKIVVARINEELHASRAPTPKTGPVIDTVPD